MMGGGLISRRLGTSFLSAIGSKLVLIKWYVGGTICGILGVVADVSVLLKEDVMSNAK